MTISGVKRLAMALAASIVAAVPTAGSIAPASADYMVAVPVKSMACPVFYRDAAGVFRPRNGPFGQCYQQARRYKGQWVWRALVAGPPISSYRWENGRLVLNGVYQATLCPDIQYVAGQRAQFPTAGGCFYKVR